MLYLPRCPAAGVSWCSVVIRHLISLLSGTYSRSSLDSSPLCIFHCVIFVLSGGVSFRSSRAFRAWLAMTSLGYSTRICCLIVGVSIEWMVTSCQTCLLFHPLTSSRTNWVGEWIGSIHSQSSSRIMLSLSSFACAVVPYLDNPSLCPMSFPALYWSIYRYCYNVLHHRDCRRFSRWGFLKYVRF